MKPELPRISTYSAGERGAGPYIDSDEGGVQGTTRKPRTAPRQVVWWDGVRLRMMADDGGESRDAAAWRSSLDDTLQYLADRAFNGRMAFEHIQALAEFRGHCPSQRTIRKHLGRMRPRDESYAWNLVDSNDAAARLILPFSRRSSRTRRGAGAGSPSRRRGSSGRSGMPRPPSTLSMPTASLTNTS